LEKNSLKRFTQNDTDKIFNKVAQNKFSIFVENPTKLPNFFPRKKHLHDTISCHEQTNKSFKATVLRLLINISGVDLFSKLALKSRL
jgi:hypothetical protein